MVELGAEIFLARCESLPPATRAVLLSHQAAVDRSGVTVLERIRRARPGLIKAVWGPQHGFYGDRQANMKASADFADPLSGLPVYSLYGELRQPTPEMFEGIDLVLVDLVDVGCRVYTYIWTLYLVLRQAAFCGVKVVVLDRPNPIGGCQVEGNLLEPEYASFVGLFPLPMRHGMTIGELALYFQKYAGIDGELEVVPCAGWRREEFFRTGLFWVLPSPNMPTPVTARVYPGQVLLEGCNLSEGRGTTLPFELCGAPFIEPARLLAAIAPAAREGVFLRPTWFTPTFDKWRGELCGGFQLHVIDPERFRPYRFTLALLQAVIALYPGEFSWLDPPYEYEYEKLPIDILTGSAGLRRGLEAGTPLAELERQWRPALEEFMCRRAEVLLYRD